MNEKNEKKFKIMIGDNVIGLVENWKCIDKNDLPKIHELPEFNPVEYALSQKYSFTFYPNKSSIPYSRS